MATKIPTEVLLAANHGVEWWEESEEGDAHWRCVRKAMDQSLGSPLFSLAIDEDTKAVAVGGGAGRATSIFGPQGDWLTQLQGHTGWVRDVLFYDKQLFSIGCNFIKVWRPKGPSPDVGWVGDDVSESIQATGDRWVGGHLGVYSTGNRETPNQWL